MNRDPDRRFDTTALTETSHGDRVHRDYAAHFFRWAQFFNEFEHQERVLDVGCGVDTPLAKVLARVHNRWPEIYVGVDLNTIRKRPGSSWMRFHDEFDFTTRWPELAEAYGVGVFDRAACYEVVEHMRPGDAAQLLTGVRELLRPGGMFYLSTPVFNGSAAKNHIHEWTIDELRDAILVAGFEIVRREGTFGNTRELYKVLTPAEKECWHAWEHRLGHEGLSVVFAQCHPDQSRNNLWTLRKPAS